MRRYRFLEEITAKDVMDTLRLFGFTVEQRNPWEFLSNASRSEVRAIVRVVSAEIAA